MTFVLDTYLSKHERCRIGEEGEETGKRRESGGGVGGSGRGRERNCEEMIIVF